MQETIKNAIKDAMRAKDMDRLNVLRLISAAFTNELVTQGHPPTDPLSDDDTMKVLKKLAKQRKDSIEQYISGGREDLADAEKAELLIVESFLPAQMSREDIVKFVQTKINDVKPELEKKGQFVGSLMKEIGGNAEGSLVKEVVDELLK